MSQQIEDESYIRRYLLGELSDEEQEQVEKRLLSDEDYYRQVMIAEDELTYDFVCGELPEEEKLSFRQHVLPVPERQKDVKFARALRKYVRKNAPRVSETPVVSSKRTSWLEALAAFFRRPAVGLSFAAALLLAVLLTAWTVIQNRKLQNQIVQLEAQKALPPTPPQNLQEQLATERQRNVELTDEVRRVQEQRASVERNLQLAKEQAQKAIVPVLPSPPRTTVATVASFLLTTGGTRDVGSGEGNKITVPGGARQIRLLLDLAANDYRHYRAVLKTVDGQKELLTRNMLRAGSSAGGITIPMIIPAKVLTRGDYQIQLSGRTSTGQYELVDFYSFRVANEVP